MKPEKFLSCAFLAVIIILFVCSVPLAITLELKFKSEHKMVYVDIDWKKAYTFESDSDSNSAPVKNTQFTQGGGGIMAVL